MSSTDQWNPRLYDAKHSFVNELAGGLMDLLAPQKAERILDLGCGTGALTQKIADAGAVALGVDSSAAMIEQARKNHPNLQFELTDALTMRFDEPFDAVFSNAALHWIKPPQAAAQRMFAALRPGGRLVLEMGGKGNVSVLLNAAVEAGRCLGLDLSPLLDINYFPSVAQYASLLEEAGFAVTFASLFDRLTPLTDGNEGLRNWLRMFRPQAVEAVPAELRNTFFSATEAACKAHLFRDGAWHADYRRLRVTALRPQGEMKPQMDTDEHR